MAGALRVGVAGLGTVGASVVDLLRRNRETIALRAGRPIEVTAVSARDRSKRRGFDTGDLRWVDGAEALALEPELDAVCELIGGSDGTAPALCRAALRSGKDVVTANKAMLALHGAELAAAADASGAVVAFEAAVAGGIPIVKALREGLAANRFSRVYGILNGTSNYILSTMEATGAGFAEVLSEAQAKGYAEADPTFDVDGFDAAHKLSILAAIAFGAPPDFDSVRIEGIRAIDSTDIAFARELGFRIKLLGVASLTGHGLEQRVQPCMVPLEAPIAAVAGAANAVVAEGDAIGSVLFEGPGAGGGPTASAVVADLIDIARGIRLPAFGRLSSELALQPNAPAGRHVGRCYVRLNVLDQPGVLAEVGAILRDVRVSIESLVQRSRNPGQTVPIVLILHEAAEDAVLAALDRIARLDVVREAPRMLRIENL